MSEKWCLITGGSKGIGYELARLFARDKYNLVLVARSEERLNRIKKDFEEEENIKVLVIPLDLLKENSVDILEEKLKKHEIEVNILVNDAGFGTSGNFINDSMEKDISIIRLNIEILTRMTHLFLNEMLKKGSGRILNVASVAAFMPGPLSAVYYATKSYVLNFSLGLAEEIKGSGVSISVLCPGPTKTDFITTANMEESKIMRWFAMPAETVAKVAYSGLMRGKLLVIPGFVNRFMVFAAKIAPLKIVMKIVKFAMLP